MEYNSAENNHSYRDGQDQNRKPKLNNVSLASVAGVKNVNEEVSSETAGQSRNGHNSRLDSMKRQFHRKLGRTLPSPQKIAYSSVDKSKTRPYADPVRASNVPRTSTHSQAPALKAFPKKNLDKSARLSGHVQHAHKDDSVVQGATLNAQNCDKPNLARHLHTDQQSNIPSSSQHHTLKTTSNLERKLPVQFRQGRAKSRAMQMQMSSSARQVLDNVLTREMKAPCESRNKLFKPRSSECNEPADTASGEPPEADSYSKVTSPVHSPPGTGTLLPNQIANSNIREKLRQHYKQNLQSRSPRKNPEANSTSAADEGNNSVDAEITSTEPSTSNQPAASNIPISAGLPNDSILHKMRQKGPMVAKRLSQHLLEDVENVASTSPKQGSVVPRPCSSNKISSRPGSPRTPRRKSSPATSGRTSPYLRRVPSPTSKASARGRNPSPKGRNSSPNRRPPSPNTDGISPYSPEATTKKVNRVLKARLYLLQQNGPNSFRIGGDSPEHKYLVVVGPQTCNCGRGLFCIHVLFVMLRVFQLEPTSGLLWRRTLKNYEVESLFKSYHERCNSRISPKKSRVRRLVSHLAHGSDKPIDGSSNSDDQNSSRGEEENCPICLLQMVDGESVTVCDVGCRNKLHTHCVNIWAEECKRNGGSLKCPLCRVVWKAADSRSGTGVGSLMVEIPPEYAQLADTWTQVFGWEMVSFLFSSHPNVRENALRRLSHDITGALLTNSQVSANEERNSDDSDSSHEGAEGGSTSNGISSNACLASCCAILAMVCADPEYRVYITALRTLRAMMAYTQCHTDEDVRSLQNLLVPVIETILLKCADSNRRTVQLSVSTVMELCRGQSGELAVGKEIVSGRIATRGVGDVRYLISFLEFDTGPDTLSWQWMLGRLNALGELFREFKSELCLSETSNGNVADSTVAQHLLRIASFASSSMRNTSQPRVVKMARKVFLQAYLFVTSNPELMSKMEELLSDVPADSKQRLLRKINAFKSVPDNSKRFIDERHDLAHSHSDDNLGDVDVLDIHSPQAPPPHFRYPHPNSNHPLYQNWCQSYPHNRSNPHHPNDNFSSNSASHQLWLPQSHDHGAMEEPHNHHPPSPCTVTHPPTPPPSSVDTANLDAAIEVSLFRPIRCVSPGRDSSKPETQVPTSSDPAQFGDFEGNISDEHSEQPMRGRGVTSDFDHDPPLRCFTVADAFARNTAQPHHVTPLQPATSSTADQGLPSKSPERPVRPSLLRLKSESSAFRDTSSLRPSLRHTSDLSGGFLTARDRSSSRESSASSTSCCDDFRRTSERRMSVRELAESINRKQNAASKSNVKKQHESSTSGLPRSTYSLPHSKYRDHRAVEKDPDVGSPVTESSDQSTRKIAKQKSPAKTSVECDDIVPSTKPLCLKAAIERRGTVERYREGLRYGQTHQPSGRPRRSNLLSRAVPEETPTHSAKGSRKSDPHISPFIGQSHGHAARAPARGILKNSGILVLPTTPNEGSANSGLLITSESATTATDSGLGSHDSTQSGTFRSSKSASAQFTSPDSESAAEETSLFRRSRDSLDCLQKDESISESLHRPVRPKQLIKPGSKTGKVSSRKPKALMHHQQLSKSNSLPKNVSSPTSPESPVHTRSEEEDAPCSSHHRRCPSAPAATLLADASPERHTLFPVKDDSIVEEASSTSVSESWSDGSTHLRRRTPVRKLPTRPKTLSQRKGRSKLKKQIVSQLSSSVEDLEESDHSLVEKTPVTFKSEIGVQTPGNFREDIVGTPTSSRNVTLPDGVATEGYENDLALQCSCRMQIAEEESKLFAHTLAISYVQDALPLVPHLSFTDEEADIVRVQDEHTDNQYEYKENKQWRKGTQIGLGAFSACYQARDIFTGSLMAVKQVNHVRCSPVEERQVLQVITEEITLMRKLSHPNVVRLHGVTKEGPLYNVFIEWCAGGSVATLLSHYGHFNEKVIINYTIQLLRGLAYIHEQHLIHRDIKGANLLIDSTGQRLRISDFGAAARLASKGTGAGEFQGQLLGTIAFMAPEVLRGEQYGRSCDVWSAGCVITEMSSGKPPWEADMHSNHLALIFKIASSPTVPPIPDRLSPAMKDLCRRCLQANPRDRPTAAEVLTHPVFIKW